MPSRAGGCRDLGGIAAVAVPGSRAGALLLGPACLLFPSLQSKILGLREGIRSWKKNGPAFGTRRIAWHYSFGY